ncbi:hypothetical protein OHC33_004332 [Knufia fluminis]|uniref:DUF7053 domain-containing protein n=1 Tax=Knufia fluminis TaxID=191047 RepID=A0AAN8EI82_9EURO|nr:hypothetical protein OHC33_004332 [Knufia fluminis]
MKTLYTTIDVIPSHIPRQLAIELLQSHGELITLNPLVLEYRPIKAPRDAPNDEFYSTWYEITQRIQFMPGIGKMGSSKVSFRGCFHDMPWGVQTHMYVPLGIELRHKYQIKGNQPGEPPEPKELGSNAPSEGLYLRVDTQIKANMTMVSFVKKELKAASKTMIERMIKKAELIDAGVLQAMFDDTGKLTTTNPNDRSRPYEPTSPGLPFTPSVYGPNGVNLRSPSQSGPRQSAYGRLPSYNQFGNSPNASQQNGLAIEMPGDTQYSQSSSNLHPHGNRFSTYSEMSGSSPQPPNGRWSGVQSEGQSSQDGSVMSYPTNYSAPNPMGSPRPEMQGGKSFAAELPGNEVVPPRPPKEPPVPENQKENQQSHQSQYGYTYNPQDYAGLRDNR